MEKSAGLLQSAFALIGDLSATAYIFVKPYVNVFMDKIVSQVQKAAMLHVSTTNNAIWATGEIALKSRKCE